MDSMTTKGGDKESIKRKKIMTDGVFKRLTSQGGGGAKGKIVGGKNSIKTLAETSTMIFQEIL